MADKTSRGGKATAGMFGSVSPLAGKPETMTKRQIIDAIMRINRTARAEFLAGFSDRELLDYLEHLQDVFESPYCRRTSESVLVAVA